MLPATLPVPVDPPRGLLDSLRALVSSLRVMRSSPLGARHLGGTRVGAPRHRLGSFDLARSSLARAFLATERFRDAESNLARAVRR